MVKHQIVILAAGKGTRMGNSNVPKVLAMLKNKPLVLHLLHTLEKITQLVKPVVVVGFGHKKVEAVLGDQYSFALQKDQLGTAHALLSARRKIKAENILVLYGDMPFVKPETLRQLIRMHLKSNSMISLCTAQVENFSGINKSLEHYGRVLRDPVSHRIVNIVEFRDATGEQKQIKEVNAGIYMFNSKWLWENLKEIKDQNAQKEYYLTEIAGMAIEQGLEIHSLLIDPAEAFGINSKQDLAAAEEILSLKS